MINFRVVNIESLVSDLKSKNVTVLDSIESFDYGKFVHIMDNEGNKIELWEPIDQVYEKMGLDMGATTIK
jgi:predicted enzyme related to lactoylglutathione lyase